MKKIGLFMMLLVLTISSYAQIEKYPVYEGCEPTTEEDAISCFKTKFKADFLNAFEVPEKLIKEGFEGFLNVVFRVDETGHFKLIYLKSKDEALRAEIRRVLKVLPQAVPASYDDRSIEMQFVFPLPIPDDYEPPIPTVEEVLIVENNKKRELKVQERSKSTLFPEHRSELNLPFNHAAYSSYDYYLDQAENTHTAAKPYVYSDLRGYVNLDQQKNALQKPKSTWFGRKLLNEHMALVKGDNYWFTINPVVDLQVGKDSEGVNTFNNTRGIQVNAGLGNNFNFSTNFYESQGRFAEYVNNYAELINPAGSEPAIIPGRGIAKEFKSDAYDYPVAEAYLSFSPSSHFNFQFGHGKNFIGDGYRSLFVSDVTSPYPFFKINTEFWKIKYTNIWMWGQDVREELTVDKSFRKKFLAMHYLSWNVSKKLNIGFFETVIWDNVNSRGFDVNYINPLIFYTSTELATGTGAGNALLGLSLKYKMKNISLYSQLIIDEFRVSEIKANNGWWANKNGIQIGMKYFNAFKIDNLFLQLEYNSVRPFTYSHDELNYNYGHNNQPMAHLWGSNFREFVGIARYTKDRWFGSAKIISGKKGFDYDLGSDTASYGGDIFEDNDQRARDYGNEIGQGNNTSLFIGDLQVGYLVNPATNLKFFGGLTFRDFDSKSPIIGFKNSNSTWFSVGLKTDLFNWYFDF